MVTRATWLCKWCFRRNPVNIYHCPICDHLYGSFPIFPKKQY